MSFDLAVVGGGVVGAAAAYRATKLGASVVVFDRDDVGRATNAGAGVVAPAVSSMVSAPWHDLAAKSARAYPELVSSLSPAGLDIGYKRVGLLTVAMVDTEAANQQFDAFVDLVNSRIEQGGHPTGHEIREISGEEAKRLFPPLGEAKRALLDTGAARVDARPLAQAMLDAAVEAGADIQRTSVESIDQVFALGARKVVVAGGAWSGRFGSELGVGIPTEPQRGQIIHLQLADSFGDTTQWPMITELGGQYQVSWPDGRVAVGATRETGSGFATNSTVEGVLDVLNEAVRVSPRLAGAAISEIRVGMRPLTPDQLPVLGEVPGHPDVMLATGHGPTGLMTGHYSGRVVADLALGQAVDIDLDPFRVDRIYH